MIWGCTKHSSGDTRYLGKKEIPSEWMGFLAEKEGFEPSIPFWGIHDFQSCALGQLRDFSKWFAAISLHIIQQIAGFVNPFFQKVGQNFCPTFSHHKWAN